MPATRETGLNTFVIDKGASDGIAEDMNVIAGSGLVGIVTKVGNNWAQVRSIIDDMSNVSSQVLSTSDLCFVKGDLQLMETGLNPAYRSAGSGRGGFHRRYGGDLARKRQVSFRIPYRLYQ